MPKQELLKLIKSGNEDAFRHFVEKYQKMVLNCAWRFTRDAVASEDITQEVFVAVYQSAGSFRGEASEATWLYRITVNLALNYCKKRQRLQRPGMFVRLSGPAKIEHQITAPPAGMPDEQAENNERARVLGEALELLPERQRAAFTLFYYEGMTYAGIAEVLKAGVPAVESLLNRAKVNLRKILDKYYKENC